MERLLYKVPGGGEEVLPGESPLCAQHLILSRFTVAYSNRIVTQGVDKSN